MLREIIINWLMQLLLTVGVIIVFGWLVWQLNKIIYKLLGRRGHAVCIATGVVGTPVHELGHAFFCVLFAHRITEIKLFEPNSDDGVLGFVAHSYNTKKPYQVIGNFFIGIAPVLFGTAILYLLMYLLTPEVLQNIFKTNWKSVDKLEWDSLKALGEVAWSGVKIIFAGENFASLGWWIFIVLAMSITIHMGVSNADIATSKLGFSSIVGLLLLVNIVLGVVWAEGMVALTAFFMSIAMLMICFFVLAILFCGILLVLAIIFRVLSTIF